MKTLAALLLCLVTGLALADSRDFTNNANVDRLVNNTAVAVLPFSAGCWGNSDTATQTDYWISIGDSAGSDYHAVGVNTTGNVIARSKTSALSAQDATSSTTFSTGTWNNALGVFNSITDRRSFLNGAGKGTNSTSRTLTTSNQTVIGAAVPFSLGQATDGRLAQCAVWSKALTDLEAAYEGAGGSPRGVSNLTHYWKIGGLSPEPDGVGTANMTVTGATVDVTEPVIDTWWIGSNIPNKSWTQNAAAPSQACTANFDDVSSAFTTTWNQLTSPTSNTTASGAGAASREITVASATTLAAGDYISITNNTTPTQVLWKSGSVLLLATARTWSNADTVYKYTVGAASIAGMSLASGSITGTPTGTLTTTPNFFCRATNSTTATLIADSNLFSITIASAPDFTIPPTVNSVTSTSVTIGGTSGSSITVHEVGCKKDSTAPTAAEVNANHCAGGSAPLASNSATWNGANTLTISGISLPVTDVYAAGPTSLVPMLDTCLAAAAGKQVINCPNGLTTIASGSVIDQLNAAITPDLVTGDIPVCDTATTPGGFALTVTATGNVSFTGDASRQYAQCRFYDLSAAAMHADTLDLWVNNHAPFAPLLNATTLFIPFNAPMTPLDLRPFCSDDDGDVLRVTGINLPTGLFISSTTPGAPDDSILQGTGTSRGIYRNPQFTCVDITGATSEPW